MLKNVPPSPLISLSAEADRAINAEEVLANDPHPVVPNVPTQAPPVVRGPPRHRPNLFGQGGRPQKRPVRRPQRGGFLAALGINNARFPFLF